MAADTIDTLTAYLPGRVFAPDTDAYQDATTPRNATARQRPAAVVAAHSPEDVAECLRAAAPSGLRVVVQATGHGAAGAVGADAMLLDTSRLATVEVDAGRRVARVGAGARLGAVNAVAYASGLLALAGTAPDVGVAGYTANGGVGWLTRPHGLASAALLSVDVVDGTGRQFRADEEQHTDVLWAYRGGGGAGVATAMELRLFPATDLVAGYLLWPAEQAAEVIPAWGDALAGLDPALSSAVGLLHAPDAPTVTESLRGRPVVHLSAATVGGEAAVRTLREVLAALPEPVVDTLGPCDAGRLSAIHLDPPAPVPAVGEGRWLTAPGGIRALDILTAAGTDPDAPLGEVELRHLAAPPSDVPGAETSLPGEVLLHATGGAPDEESRRAVLAALETVLAAARPVDTGRSSAAFRDGRESAPDALPDDIRVRLARIRRETDPAGLLDTPRVGR